MWLTCTHNPTNTIQPKSALTNSTRNSPQIRINTSPHTPTPIRTHITHTSAYTAALNATERRHRSDDSDMPSGVLHTAAFIMGGGRHSRIG